MPECKADGAATSADALRGHGPNHIGAVNAFAVRDGPLITGPPSTPAARSPRP